MKMDPKPAHRTPPQRVHETLKRKLLIDGFEFVFDPVRSEGAWLVDARDGSRYLDLFSFFASAPLGYNHPGLRQPEFRARLLEAALTKPTCSDVYSEAQADFVDTFSRTLPSGFEHLFFIEGGALAVENALKVAFDWKVQKNRRAGRGDNLGRSIVHFKSAFHGRSGYTLSMTNTADPRKFRDFPMFDWPRIPNPGLTFPLTTQTIAATALLEQQALDVLDRAIRERGHDLAAIIIESIQGEGGDVHFRPEFMRALRSRADDHEMLLIFDEVQSGMGLTGRWWAFEHSGVMPDIFSFGKKTQVCGIAATKRCDDVDSVFKIPSRINSTWGGNLVDMVRCERFIEIIEQEGLLAAAADTGAYALERLEDLAGRHSILSNVRGKGLMLAFDLPDTARRDALRKLMLEEKTIILGCGDRSIRFRPALDFPRDAVDTAVQRIENAIRRLA
jgi:L-lysine 6-transaminase